MSVIAQPSTTKCIAYALLASRQLGGLTMLAASLPLRDLYKRDSWRGSRMIRCSLHTSQEYPDVSPGVCVGADGLARNLYPHEAAKNIEDSNTINDD